MNIQIDEFIKQLSSKSPVPGGGASALIGVGVVTTSVLLKHTIQSAIKSVDQPLYKHTSSAETLV